MPPKTPLLTFPRDAYGVSVAHCVTCPPPPPPGTKYWIRPCKHTYIIDAVSVNIAWRFDLRISLQLLQIINNINYLQLG